MKKFTLASIQSRQFMKSLLTACVLFAFSALFTHTNAQTFCNTSGNIVLFTNYDGGVLNINVNANIPNLKIGVVSYEAVQINLSGTYLSNVTEVRYAGYNSGNNNCGSSSISTTSINGVASTVPTSISFAPSSPLSNSNGYGSIICGYSCSTTSNQGGCNTVDQIEAYWLAQFSGSSIYSHKVQYGCWAGTTQNVASGGTCCATVITNPIVGTTQQQNPSCSGQCNGSASVSATGGTTPYTYAWSNGQTTASISNLCAGTYTVTITGAGSGAGNTAVKTVTLTAPSAIVNNQTFTECEGFSVTIGSSVYSATGNYTNQFVAANGCDSIVNTNLTILPKSVIAQTITECEGFVLHIGSSTYTTSGTYIDTLQKVNGCDSIITTTLVIHPIEHVNQTIIASICEGISVEVGSNVYTSSGIYIDTLIASTGCDSIVTTTLDLLPENLIATHPIDATEYINTIASFSVSSNQPNSTYQWQQNSGTGFVNLSNAGIYSGTDSDQLSIQPLSASLHNYEYRCVLVFGTCEATSESAHLNIIDNTSIYEGEQTLLVAYPNPVHKGKALILSQAVSGTIYSALGQAVQQVNNQTTVFTDQLNTGLFVLVANTGARIVFVVE